MIGMLTGQLGAMTGMTSSVAGLAYRPFLEPIDAHSWWWLMLLPLALGISMVYKAMRIPVMDRYWWQTGKMTAQILSVMILLSIVLLVLVQVILPLLPVR